MRILFVCLGNICRSPAGEGILRSFANRDKVDLVVASCGIGDWHVGQLPDHRMREAASERGITLTSRAKVFLNNFLDEFDYILASDREVLEFLHKSARTPEHKAKLHLMTAFGTTYKNQDVPDPYYGGPSGFDHTLDILEDACEGLLKEIKSST